ncbi:metal ABC transporter permease [Oenococcus kitaharae]|uniref:metal ABC transporter permease n=3 Tax=Lactobacillaceae TaxID=33958 RepID=UPI0021E90047|nr:metal ABC transporter permease [Oenococcus kitaharae]MCV3295634.1 metal ABC transporter permease [Oenococcus kitaharae]
MLSLDFMQHAYEAGTIVAILCGIVGVFVVARKLSFLAHTLSEIGFSGAAFGVWIGWAPFQSMMLFTFLSSILASRIGINQQRRDAATSSVSALFMGLGVLFLSFSSKNASYTTSILFGSIVGISFGNVIQIIVVSMIVMILTMLIYRRLKFDSFDQIGSQITDRKNNYINIIFIVMMALSVSVASQIVGALLIFILLTLPAYTAQFYARSVSAMIFISIGLSLVGTWLGLYLAYETNWPVTFFIAAIETFFYLASLFAKTIKAQK